MTRVTLYGRSGCHLCDTAREMLDELRRSGLRFQLTEVDIDSDDELLRRYLERIPVIEVEGAVISELIPDRNVLRASLDTLDT